ncbi:MAG: polyhydroxybutyrate depolymerase, partial [Frankiales bacterium]|nr:polyhydroxybutyrate depolymerase [Frankiales bacterium]
RTSVGCPVGTAVTLYTSATLGHTWSAGAASAATYGLDMLGLIYGFDAAIWAGKPSPAPYVPQGGTPGAAPLSTTVASSAAPRAAAGTTTVIRLPLGGTMRSYRLFQPSAVQTGPRPILLALHGESSDATRFEDLSNLDQTAAKSGYDVVYPDGVAGSWNAGGCCGSAASGNVDDVAYLAAVLADAAKRTPIDRNRIAMAGFSNGGMMAYRFACERADLVHTIDVVAGAFLTQGCAPTRPVSVLHIHGLADTVVPSGGTATSPLSASGFPAANAGPVTIAISNGCTSSVKGIYNGRADVSTWQAASCPTDAVVQLIRPTKLAHLWTSSSAEATTYGVNASAMTWSFDAASWALQPAPIAL